MREPRLTEQADLDDLWAYIATNNPDAADRLVDAVLEGSRMHVRFPGMGQDRDDLRAGLRCWLMFVGQARVIPRTDTGLFPGAGQGYSQN